jgi:hypothetical protein
LNLKLNEVRSDGPCPVVEVQEKAMDLGVTYKAMDLGVIYKAIDLGVT